MAWQIVIGSSTYQACHVNVSQMLAELEGKMQVNKPRLHCSQASGLWPTAFLSQSWRLTVGVAYIFIRVDVVCMKSDESSMYDHTMTGEGSLLLVTTPCLHGHEQQ